MIWKMVSEGELIYSSNYSLATISPHFKSHMILFAAHIWMNE